MEQNQFAFRLVFGQWNSADPLLRPAWHSCMKIGQRITKTRNAPCNFYGKRQMDKDFFLKCKAKLILLLISGNFH